MAIADGLAVNATNSNPAWVGQEYFTDGFTTTATAAGTTTLTVSSPSLQEFTGSTTQTVVLPNATTLVVGRLFRILNRSTGIVTVKLADGSTTAYAVPANSASWFITKTIVTSNGTWSIDNVISVDSSGNVTITGTLATGGAITTGTAAGTRGSVTAVGTASLGPFLQLDNTAGSGGKSWKIGDGLTIANGTFEITDATDSITIFKSTSTAITLATSTTVTGALTATGTVTGPAGTYSGALTTSLTTDSTTPTTGALKSAGGLGVVKNASIGATLFIGASAVTSGQGIVDMASVAGVSITGTGGGTTGGGTADFPAGSTTPQGLLFVTNRSTGKCALIMVTIAGTTVVSDPSSIYSNTQGTASKDNVYINSTNIRIEHNSSTSTTQSFSLTWVRTGT